MNLDTASSIGLGLAVVLALGGSPRAQSILVLNGTGVSTVGAPLAAAGFNVIGGTLDPGQISSNLAADPSIVEIWIWNDGTYPLAYDPIHDFDANDLADLDAFVAVHPHWIMDGLAWRNHTTVDELSLSANEAVNLAASGGGVVLGADDDSALGILQHVNQVAAHMGFSAWFGTYLVIPAQALATGVLVSSPSSVDPTDVNASISQCDVPNGPQPNGLVLFTALFAAPGVDYPGWTNPPLATEFFNGVLYRSVDHLITTTLPGGGFTNTMTASYCFGDGTATACPCGNSGNAGAGCDNSFNTGGGVLGSSGVASVSADTFELDGSGMPPSASALYFQGAFALNDAQGVLFGDGLRCVGGTVIRLGTRTNSGGMSGYGAPLGDLAISLRGSIPASGGTFYYQAWYRNTAPFCTAAGFNLTNALGVAWAP